MEAITSVPPGVSEHIRCDQALICRDEEVVKLLGREDVPLLLLHSVAHQEHFEASGAALQYFTRARGG